MSTSRVAVFLDYQNVYNGAREAFELCDRPSRYGQIDPLLNRSTTVYDVASQRVAMINPVGARTTTIYDADLRGLATINPLGRRSTLVYNGANQQIAQGGIWPAGFAQG